MRNSSASHPIVFHYTSRQGEAAILETGIIPPSPNWERARSAQERAIFEEHCPSEIVFVRTRDRLLADYDSLQYYTISRL